MKTLKLRPPNPYEQIEIRPVQLCWDCPIRFRDPWETDMGLVEKLREEARTSSKSVADNYRDAADEIERLSYALEPLAGIADRKEYTLDDIDHGWFINAKLALRK